MGVYGNKINYIIKKIKIKKKMMTKSDLLYSRFIKIIEKKIYKSGTSNLLLDKIYSRDAFNIRVFVIESNESSP